jgi:hypothetical protein
MRERLYRVITGRVGEELQTRRATLLLDAGARGGGLVWLRHGGSDGGWLT